ncbi:MAG: hypothetical protein KA292_13425 [Sphingorhabdus sp.]|nr:hypothetical protein [Sphingorhabdus sp.]
MSAGSALGRAAGALGRSMIRTSRWVQRTCLGLRVPACRIREKDLTNELFRADREVEIAERSLAFWRAEQVRLVAQIDGAWRDSAALIKRIDALKSDDSGVSGASREGRGESWPA